MFCPRMSMVSIASVSLSTSPLSMPNPMFQYREPGTIICSMKKKALSVLKVWIAPPRRAVTDCCADLACEHIVVGPANHAGAIYEGAHFGRKSSEVGGGAEDDAVGFVHGHDTVVDEVVVNRTSAVFVFVKHFHAGDTAVHLFAAKLNEFGLDAFGLECRKNAF